MYLKLIFIALLSFISQTYGNESIYKIGNAFAYDRIDLSKIKFKDLTKKEEIIFVAFGDSGSGPNEDYQYVVAKQMFKACKLHKCDFGIMLGDNFYEGDYSYDGVQSVNDPKFQDMFEIPYADFRNLKNFYF